MDARHPSDQCDKWEFISRSTEEIQKNKEEGHVNNVNKDQNTQTKPICDICEPPLDSHDEFNRLDSAFKSSVTGPLQNLSDQGMLEMPNVSIPIFVANNK